MRTIAKYSRLHGHWIFSRETDFYHAKKVAIKNESVDGLIARVSSKQEAKELSSRKTPVIIQCVHERIADCPTIEVDDIGIGQMAAQHLLERGFKNFAFCGMEKIIEQSEQRLQAILDKVHDVRLLSRHLVR